MDAHTLLKHFAVRGTDYPEVYLLGCRSRRVTVYDQQVRAFNLVSALVETKRIEKRDRVAIVGAGIGGLTAAAAAGRIGARVDVFDERDEPLTLQKSSRQRLLHPGISDWPGPGFQRSATNFHLMNWTAGMSNVVAQRLMRQWTAEQISSSIGYNDPDKQARKVIDLERDGTRWTLQFERQSPATGYRVVILAIGFGLEKTVPGRTLQSYWRDYDLDPPLDTAPSPIRYLVAGDVDGALIDVLRVVFKDFSHDTLLSDLKLEVPSLEGIRQKLLAIEEEAKAETKPATFLKEEYERLVVPNELTDHMKRLVRHNTDVTLVTHDDTPFSLKSSILHRFLLSILLRENLVSHHQGKLERVDGNRPNCTALCAPVLPNDSFYDVIVRIGPEPALKTLPKISALYPDRIASADDPTREPRTTNWDVFRKNPVPFFVDTGTTTPPQIGYFVGSNDDASRIELNGFRDHDRIPFENGPVLVLFEELAAAERSAHAKSGRVIEVSFQAALLERKNKKLPAGASYRYLSGSDKCIALADINCITRPKP